MRAEVLWNATARANSATVKGGFYLGELDLRGELWAMQARILKKASDAVGNLLRGRTPQRENEFSGGNALGIATPTGEKERIEGAARPEDPSRSLRLSGGLPASKL